MFEVNFEDVDAEGEFEKHFILRITPKTSAKISQVKIKHKTTKSYIQGRVSSLLSKKRNEIKSAAKLEFGIFFNGIARVKPVEGLSDYPGAVFSMINYPGYSNDLRPFNYVVLEGDISEKDITSSVEDIISEIKKSQSIKKLHLKNIKSAALEKLVEIKFPENIKLQITADNENDRFNKIKDILISKHEKNTVVNTDLKFKFVIGEKVTNLEVSEDVDAKNVDSNNSNYQFNDAHHTDDEDEKNNSPSKIVSAEAEVEPKVSDESSEKENKNNQTQNSTVATELSLNNLTKGNQIAPATDISISNPLLNRSLQTIGTLLRTSQEEAEKLEKSQILQQEEISRCHSLIAELTSKQLKLQKQLKQAELKNVELEKENRSFKKINSYKIGETAEISHQQFLDIIIEAESARAQNQELMAKNQSLENSCNELKNENIFLKRKMDELEIDLKNARNKITEFNTEYLGNQNPRFFADNIRGAMQHPGQPTKYRKSDQSGQEKKIPTAYGYSESNQFNNSTAQTQRRGSDSTMQSYTAPYLTSPSTSNTPNPYYFFNERESKVSARQISPLQTYTNEQATYSVSTVDTQPDSKGHPEENSHLDFPQKNVLHNR